ncbi:MAG: Transcriptional regulatory protein UhpA [Firmicutes bacterium ADurb.Bin182]|nr:MAG: Transcriptional regulatory protein UhpA [Firmicutes bacterium ADurb.Bin182]
MKQPVAKQNYLSRLLISFSRLWSSKDDLSFKNIRVSHLHYFLALPLGLGFSNAQEILFKSDFSLMGLDALTIALSAYCIGAGLLFALVSVRNMKKIAISSAILTLAGFIPWMIMSDGPAAVILAAVFMFGMGGSVSCAVFVYTFVLNNPERFFGAIIASFFCTVVRFAAGLPDLPPLISKAFMFLLVAGTVFCLILFKATDFDSVPSKRRARLNPPILLALYFFIAGFCADYFYAYLPGTSEPGAMIISGLSGAAAVCLAAVVQTAAKRSVWHMCNLFFIAMACCYALFFAPAGSFLRDAAVFLYGFRLIGYTLMFYLLGCVFKKHGDFRLFKICVVVVLTAGALAYIIPDTIHKNAPELLLPAATATSGAIFLVFMLLSPAYAKHLFSDDASEDFHRLDMSEAEKKVAKFDQLENLDLTLREKEVAVFLLRGMTTRQIAGELRISYHTANFHTKNLYKKLGISGRMELFSRIAEKA